MDVLNSIFKENPSLAKITRENELYKGRNDKYPFLCGAVSVGFDTTRKRFVRAIEDIPCGKVVCVDEGITIPFTDARCSFCVSTLKPKEKRYCAPCRVDKRCKLIRQVEDGCIEELRKHGMLELAVRVALSFPPKEIAECIKTGPPSPTTGCSSKSFHSISLLQPASFDSPDVRSLVAPAVKMVVDKLDRHPEWSKMGSEKEEMFTEALHLIMARVPSNAHSVFMPTMDSNGAGVVDSMLHEVLEDALWPSDSTPEWKRPSFSTSVPLAIGFFPTASILNHSCRPNTFSYFHQNRMVFVSRGIRKGEEVTDSYGPTAYTHPLDERQHILKGRGFRCRCVECRYEAVEGNPLHKQPLLSDAEHAKITNLVKPLTWSSRFAEASRVVVLVEKTLSPADPMLLHCYRMAAVTAAYEGNLSEAEKMLEKMTTAYALHQSAIDKETAMDNHALALVFLADYHRTGDRQLLRKSRIHAFRALTQYTTIYGLYGVLTRSVLRFIKERELTYD